MSTTLEFTKSHGAGNDFIILDGIRKELPAVAPIAAKLANRNFGIGCDQILVVRPSSKADFTMEIFNADGGQVEMCANGIRAFYKYLRDHGHTSQDEIAVETLSGIVYPRWAGQDQITVNMGQPILEPSKIPTTLSSGQDRAIDVELEVGSESVVLTSVSMGNPHAVIFVEDVENFPVETLGPQIETHPAFPNRVNVEFVELESRTRVLQRTWERGTGETLACGSGACAVTVACILRGVTEQAITVVLRGGELSISWENEESSIWMTGPATEVFSGRIELKGD